MPKFMVRSHETTYYETIVYAENEDEARWAICNGYDLGDSVNTDNFEIDSVSIMDSDCNKEGK